MYRFVKKLLIAVIACMPPATYARTLHIGDWAMPLSPRPVTTHNLHIKFNDDETVYGAMFDTPAPDDVLHIRYADRDYWVGPWCPPGTYLPTGARDCRDCGLGHYCAGGMHRAACTGGAIACNGINATVDAAADPSLVNRTLTPDEVTRYIPGTDFSQWRELSCCNTAVASKYLYTLRTNLEQMFLPDIEGCPVHTFGPGTYLFITAAAATCPVTNYVDAFNAHMGVIANAASFKQLLADGYFYIHVDTESTGFRQSSFRVSQNYYCTGQNNTNISHVTDFAQERFYHMCVYELE